MRRVQRMLWIYPHDSAGKRPRAGTIDAAGSHFPAAGAVRSAANPAFMSSPSAHVEQFERVLLRRGVGALEADRNRCADCGRTPLTGEQVHLYAGHQSTIVCELCRWRHRDAPVASELVRHCEHGHAVRLTRAA